MKKMPGLLACLLVFAALFQAEPSSAASVHDFFPACAALTDAAGQTLIVDPSGKTEKSYIGIAAALKVAKPGDKISLMSADYGALSLDGKNSDFITLEAAPAGQTHPNSTITLRLGCTVAPPLACRGGDRVRSERRQISEW